MDHDDIAALLRAISPTSTVRISPDGELFTKTDPEADEISLGQVEDLASACRQVGLFFTERDGPPGRVFPFR